MSPDNLTTAPRKISLTGRARSALRSELEERPSEFLAETPRAILDLDAWVEQECFLVPNTQAS